jgi:hypothetical protein
VPLRPLVEAPEEILELVRLVRAGRLYSEAAMYVALTRTPAMQEKLSRSGFGPHYLDVTSGPTGYKKKVRRRGRIPP